MTDDTHEQAAIEKVGTHAISITRDFAADIDRVFAALHEPELVAQWIGPDRLDNTEVTQENRHGGTWTLVQRDHENQFGFRGVLHGDPTPPLSQRTFEWLGLPGHTSFESTRLEDLGDGRTRSHAVMVFLSTEDRDGMWDAGMAGGVNAGYAKLDALLARP